MKSPKGKFPNYSRISSPFPTFGLSSEEPLIEAFLVFGFAKPASPFTLSETAKYESVSPPQLLDSYPSTLPLSLQNINLPYLCSPRGYLPVEVPAGGHSPAKAFNYVTITDDTGKKRYATTLCFYEIFGNDKAVIVYPTCFCTISRLPIFDFQKSVLKTMHSAFAASKTTYPLEFYISLVFHHLSYSADLQNEVEVVSGNCAPFVRYRNYKAVGLTLPNFTVQALIENVKPKQIMDIVRCLLLEKKVILVRDNCSDNALLIETILMLLSPFQWNFVNISYLTTELIEYIDAPMPYIIGVPRFIWKEIKKIRPKSVLSQEAAIFDLNKDKLTFSERVPDWPIKEVAPVYACLQEIVEGGTRLQFSRTNSTEYARAVSEYWAISSLKIKKAFFLMFVKLLGNYLRFFHAESEEFNYTEYITSVEPQKRPFMKELVRTQNFASFMDKTYHCIKERNDAAFFIEGTKLHQTKGEKALEGEIKKVFDHIINNYKNPLLVSLEHCYKRYEKYLESSKVKTPKEIIQKGYIKRADVIQMPRINYFTLREARIKEYIFQVEKSNSINESNNCGRTIIRTCGSANNSITISTSDTFRANTKRTLQPNLDESRPKPICEFHKKPKKVIPDPDLDEESLVADEFHANETHVSDDFVKRKLEKSCIPSLCGLSPSAKYFAKEEFRPRSISSFAMVTSGLFNRCSQVQSKKVGLINHETTTSMHTESMQAKGKEVDRISLINTEKECKTERKMFSTERLVLRRNPFEVETRISVHGKATEGKKAKGAVTERCLKMVEAMENKGTHKFANTTQPPQKAPHTCTDIEETKTPSHSPLLKRITHPMSSIDNISTNIFSKKGPAIGTARLSPLYKNLFANV